MDKEEEGEQGQGFGDFPDAEGIRGRVESGRAHAGRADAPQGVPVEDMHGALAIAGGDHGYGRLGEQDGQAGAEQRMNRDQGGAQRQVEHQAAGIDDEQQPLLALAHHEVGGEVVHEAAEDGAHEPFLHPHGIVVILAVDQADDPVRLDKEHEHDGQGHADEPAHGIVGQPAELGPVVFPQPDEQRIEDAAQKQVGDQDGDAVDKLPGDAVLGDHDRSGLALQEIEVGLVVEDGGQGHEHEHAAVLGRGPGPSQGFALEGEPGEVGPGQGQPDAAGEVDAILDELEQRDPVRLGAERQQGDGIAVADDAGQDPDAPLQFLASLDPDGHEKGAGNGLQAHAGGNDQHEIGKPRGVMLDENEHGHAEPAGCKQNALEQGVLGQDVALVAEFLAQGRDQGLVEAEFPQKQDDGGQAEGDHEFAVIACGEPSQVDEEKRVQAVVNPLGAGELGEFRKDTVGGAGGTFPWRG